MLAHDLCSALEQTKLSDSLVPDSDATIGKHNSAVDTLINALGDVGQPPDCTPLEDPKKFLAARAAAVGTHLEMLMRARKLALTAAEILDESREVHLTAIAEAKDALTEVKEQTASALSAAGYSPQDQPQYRHNRNAGARAFDFQVQAAIGVRESKAALVDAENQLQVAGERSKFCKDLAAQIEQRLTQLLVSPLESIFPILQRTDNGRQRWT
jgi:hypothetical protein